MRPILVEFELPVLGLVTFPAYLTMLMVGFLVAIAVGRRQAEAMGLSGQKVVDLGILMLVLGIAGSRLLAVLTDGKFMEFVHLCTAPTLVPAVDSQVALCTSDVPCDFHYVCDLATSTCHPPRDCLAALKFWQGGLTYYGGLLAAIPGGLWYARRKGLGALVMADLAAPLIMLGLFFGRWGCFLNGCCYGAPTSSWPGVMLPGHSQPVHPTQLYEGFGALALAVVLYYVIRPRKRGDGEVLGWLLALYGVMRIVIELFRADPRGSLGPLSTSQILSIPLIAAGIWLIVWVRRQPAPSSQNDTDKQDPLTERADSR